MRPFLQSAVPMRAIPGEAAQERIRDEILRLNDATEVNFVQDGLGIALQAFFENTTLGAAEADNLCQDAIRKYAPEVVVEYE